MYGIQIIDGRQAGKAKRLMRNFKQWIHGEVRRSPLTIITTNVDVALMSLKLLRSHNVKAKVVYQF